MPHDYNPDTKRFTSSGRPVSQAKVRAEIEKLTQHVSREAAKIGRRYAKGEIGIAVFEELMRELLKLAHIISASVGRGGRERMTLSDWGRVGARLKKEYEYLRRFANKLVRGIVAKPLTPHRAKMYSSSIVMSYHDMVRKEETQDSKTDIRVKLVQTSKEGCEECNADAARGFIRVEDMSPIGTRICKNFCGCYLVFSDEEV